MKSVNDIRSVFLDYFKRNGHEVRPSSSLVPHNDPTLMFANAGMNQFKNIFTGVEKADMKRATTSQKVVRAGGKHNDLDNVGYTARHHTFFEMLGNFSFGDYFKEDAIKFAWELLTKDYGLSPDKLSFTVYHTDDQAFDLWKKITGCDDRRIIRVPTNDNFWMMGDTGPCGPCSEIFYDHGEKGGEGEWALNADGSDRFSGRFVEIWNLVFMQFDQLEGGARNPLPKPSIDTGMGLERIAAVMQGTHDNYDIDLFKHLITDIKDKVATLGGKPSTDAAPYKVIADHLRSSVFLIADGVMPSNEGRGYVLRRIMRRAMRYAHQLGCKDPLMYHLVPALVKEMGDAYPEIKRAEATVIDNLRQEEERFKQTLERGLKLLEEHPSYLVNLPEEVWPTKQTPRQSPLAAHRAKFPGDVAFKLYDTYGFPLDLTQDILRARGIEVDVEGFEKAMDGQRDMARASHKGSGDSVTGKIWFAMKEELGVTEFDGYEKDEADSIIFALVKDGASVQSAAAGEEVFIVLDHTPFYGESGGQVGDTGTLTVSGKKIADIIDTQKPLDDFIVHKAKLLAPIKLADKVHAAIDATRRNATRANHSATHLLHKALRDKLGEHVTQKGSLVDSNRLRFDFSHTKPVAKEEIAEIERKVNDVVWRNTPVVCKVMTPDDAINAGAMALFGEKYGDKVRVLSMGEDNGATYSTELCGGTHVRATGDIGMFKITSEGGIAAGIRRIESVTGEAVRQYFITELNKQYEQLQKLQEDQAKSLAELAMTRKKLGGEAAAWSLHAASRPASLEDVAPRELQALFEKEAARIAAETQSLQDENKKLSKELSEAKKQLALGSSGGDVTAEKVGNVMYIGKAFDGLDPKELRPMVENYRKQADVIALGTSMDGKASIVIAVNNPSDSMSAVTLVQAAVAELGGKGGGGRPDMAQGGGPEGSKLESAMALVKAKIA